MARVLELANLALDATKGISASLTVWNRRPPISIPPHVLDFMAVVYTHNFFNEAVIVFVSDQKLSDVLDRANETNFSGVTFGIEKSHIEAAMRQAQSLAAKNKVIAVGHGVGGVLAQFVAGNSPGIDGVTFNAPSPTLSREQGQFSWINWSRLGQIRVDADDMPAKFGKVIGNQPIIVKGVYTTNKVGYWASNSITEDAHSPFTSWNKTLSGVASAGKVASAVLRATSIPGAIAKVAESVATDVGFDRVKNTVVNAALAYAAHQMETVVDSIEQSAIRNGTPDALMRG